MKDGRNAVITLFAVCACFATILASCTWFETDDGEPGTYTVRYHARGAVGEMAPSVFTGETEHRLPLNAFIPPEGYVFAGWSEYSSAVSATYADGSTIIKDKYFGGRTLDLYAVWRGINYTIVYDVNGGTGRVESSVFTYGAHEETNVGYRFRESTHYLTDTDKYILNRIAREGYTFMGWAETPEGELKYVNGQLIEKNLTAIEGTVITLYAVWSTGAYTVKYNANGGSGTMADSVFYRGMSYNLPANAFTGWEFLGWATSPDGEVEYADGQSVIDLGENAWRTVILYAVWSGNAYTVRYDANGGSGTMEDSTFLINVTRSLPANAFICLSPVTGTSYQFRGWAMSPDQSWGDYADGQRVTNLTETPGETVTLYAIWGINYYVRYDANGGSGTMWETSFTYDVPQNLRTNAFTRTNYLFRGWATSRNGGVEYTDGQTVTNVPEAWLYAVWSGTYTVKYYANGGSGTMADSFFIMREEHHLPPNAFTREGYTFTGWRSPLDNYLYRDEYQFTSGLTDVAGSTVTLTAMWGENYTVVYNANGGSGNMEDSAFARNMTQSLRANAFIREHYRFDGWATSPSATTAQYADEQRVSELPSGKTVTLYALWRGFDYTVKYDANGGSGAMADSAFVYGTARNLQTNTFTRTGYTFTGWAQSPNGTVVYSNGASALNLSETADAAVTLYAVWQANAYTVNYNANGGGGSMSGQSFIYDAAQDLRANNFSRTGYAFAGWSMTANGDVAYTGGQSVSNLTEAAGAAVTLYAQWNGNPYTVTYDANDGSGSMADSAFIYGTAHNLRANTFTRVNYRFNGWATSPSATTAQYADGAGVSGLTATAGATVTLYAVWTDTYTVKYHANGGSGSMADSVFTYSVAQNLRMNTLSRAGYTFTGWATSSSATTAQYADRQSVNNLATTEEAAVTLYAVWSGNPYTVRYSANGGNGNMPASTFTYGQLESLSANIFTRTGYTFAGWAKDSSATTRDYTGMQRVSNLTTESTITLYAVWNGIQYNVSFYANGGSGTMSSQSFTYGTAQALSRNAFTRTGYVFAGWATTPGGAVEYTAGQSVNNLTSVAGATVALYAVWEHGKFTVIYYPNGGSGGVKSEIFYIGVEGQYLSPNTFTRANYTFEGWATSATGTMVLGNVANISNWTNDPGRTVTLYAVWRYIGP